MISLTSADDFCTGWFESNSFEWETTIALTGTQFPPCHSGSSTLILFCITQSTHPSSPSLPQPWLLSHVVTPWALSNMVQHTGFGQALTHELLLSHLPLFYWNRWGTATEAGGDRGLSVAPLSTYCPAIPMMRHPALRGTFALEGNPGDWDGLTVAKHCPGPPTPSLTAPKKFIPTPSSQSLILLPFLGGSPANGKKLSH